MFWLSKAFDDIDHTMYLFYFIIWFLLSHIFLLNFTAWIGHNEYKELKTDKLHEVLHNHEELSLPATCLAHSLTPKTGVVYFSETSVNFYWTAWHHTPKDGTLHCNCCENLNSNINKTFGEELIIYFSFIGHGPHRKWKKLWGDTQTDSRVIS
jgi:hypothetical protein